MDQNWPEGLKLQKWVDIECSKVVFF